MGVAWIIMALIGIAHFFLAMLATSDVTTYPVFNKKQKVMWLLILWLLPIAGTLLVHKKLGLGWRGGTGTGGDGTHCGYDGGDIDGGGGGND